MENWGDESVPVTRPRAVNAVANEVEETEFRDWNFSPNCSDLRPSRPRTFQK